MRGLAGKTVIVTGGGGGIGGATCVRFAEEGAKVAVFDIVKAAGYWLTEGGRPMARFSHICWDGCMFANKVLSRPKTWNDILATLIRVRDAHGLPW